MKVACIIPARGGSKGIPKKNIIDFNGNPLIYYSIKQALESKHIDAADVYVTSDSKEILDISKSFGAIPILRPDNISSDTSSSESALIHAINQISDEYDTIVFLQATSPIRTSIDIDNCIDEFIEGDLDSLFSAGELDDFLIWEKDDNGKLCSVNYDYENRKRRQDSKIQYVENGSIYVFKKDGFLEGGNRLFGNQGLCLMDKWKMFEIDEPGDVELCEKIYASKIEEPKVGKILDERIREIIKSTLDKDKFPDYDNIYTDTFSELIDKLCIVHIRYWYLEDSMAFAKDDEELVSLRKKSESLFKEKRPMLVAGIDKFITQFVKGDIELNPINVKHYKGWKQKEI